MAVPAWSGAGASRLAPEDVFAPLADATPDLVTNIERARIRKCPACVLHFYDTNKGTRTWYSMKMCGNRAKVAAFAERQRAVPKAVRWREGQTNVRASVGGDLLQDRSPVSL
jgi:predicted RNA-binding Zn ribbon-like protein